jgi:beta-RFAP synthase
MPPHAVRVSAPGRLHLGFLDPSGTLGRRFGSLGMMLEETATVVRLARSSAHRVHAAPVARHEVDRVERLVAKLRSATGFRDPLDVFIEAALPPHVGLGSGTQIALALGRAFAELHCLQLSTPALASLLGRGGRSGIGIAGFDVGGVLVDGGPRTGSNAPPVLARIEFPQDWRVVLVQDAARCGLHGENEAQGIARLPTFPQQQAAHLCHLVLMQILPGLVEGDFLPFARGLTEVQRIVGEYFAPAQGGVYTSPATARLMRWISERHEAAVGQSSWGPTAFAILPSLQEAQRVVESAKVAKAAGVTEAGLDITIVAGRNRGADIVRSTRAGDLPEAEL